MSSLTRIIEFLTSNCIVLSDISVSLILVRIKIYKFVKMCTNIVDIVQVALVSSTPVTNSKRMIDDGRLTAELH